MKLKHHLWIAFGIIIISLFLSSIVSTTQVPAYAIDKESITTIWKLMWENLFTKIPTNDVIESLGGMGLTEAQATALIDENGTGNSLLSGLLGLLPILATLVGVILVTFKDNVKKWLLYGSFGLVFVSVWTIWFTAPTKLNGVESMYNSIVPTLGTAMKDGTEITMAIGLFVASIGALYGIVALVLNKLDKIKA
ncbi:hypothetical protein CI105_08470 [Candidatus Izimaplasma bacterium ZiA1]|uniref:hypothetical protein n=1 Tax=Candidatus Izimoplasma sp. ZiA1 TaxID=2024899 RepID=UPI000BAA53D6|nr:hypothetical protein CI105_08470 [Candidatus Izimaplasma bacterium ZiA1]